MADASLDLFLSKLSTQEAQANPKSIAVALASVVKREDGPQFLRSNLQNGADPLQAIPPAVMTLPYLYILTARLTGQGAQPVHPDYIVNFCRMFDPTQARYAPERITILAKSIISYGESLNNPEFALEPLHNLITHYPPSLSYLTTIHTCFLIACIESRQYAAALPILETSIVQFDKSLSDLDYTDVLQYYYLGGVVFAVARKYDKAEAFLEAAVSAPANTPSAIQLEAFKKLTLVQLIRHGKTLSLPKYTNGALIKQMKAIPQYAALVKAYPTIKGSITDLIHKEANFFTEEGNFSLIKIVVEYGSRWALKALMRTYSSLSVSQVVQYIHLQNEQQAKEIITQMINNGELAAELLPDGTLNFHEDAMDEQAFAPAAIQALLLKAQQEGRELQEMNQVMAASRQLLAKALKERESPYTTGGNHPPEDEFERWGTTEQQMAESLFD